MNLNDTCFTQQEIWPELIDRKYVKVFFGFCYTLFFVIGVFGNCVVLSTMFGKSEINLNVRRVFILSLTCADTLILLTCLPVTFVTNIERRWLFGAALCHLSALFQAWSTISSSLTFASIAVDRYLLIAHPGKPIITFNRATAITVSLWVVALALSLPSGIFSRILPPRKHVCGENCGEMWPSDGVLRKVYGVVLPAVQYAIPALTTIISYTGLIQVVKRQSETRIKSGNVSTQSNKKLTERRRTTTRMTIVMVSSFIVAWLPLNIFNLLRDYKVEMSEDNLWMTICHITAMTSSICNPVIYSWFNPRFRKIMLRPFQLSACRKGNERMEGREGETLLTVGHKMERLGATNDDAVSSTARI